MAVTIALDLPMPKRPQGMNPGLAILTGTIKDSYYATGGTDLTGITSHFKKCLRIVTDSPGGFLTQWDKTNKKLIIFDTVDGVAGTRSQVAANTDLSTTPGTFSFIAFGLI